MRQTRTHTHKGCVQRVYLCVCIVCVWCVCVCVCVIHLFVGEARPLTDAPLAQSFVLHHGSQPGLLRKDARCLNSALHVRSVHGAVRIADKGHSVPHIRGIFEQQSGECPLQ